MSYLALIDKNFFKYCDNLKKRNKIIDLSVQEIINKYQGFEGELKGIFTITKSETDLQKIIDFCLEIHNQQKYSLFFITENNKVPDLITHQFLFMGYDYGIFEEEMDAVYSSIFNEILFGNVEELILNKNKLNKFFLFDNKEEAENYVNIHHTALVKGKNVEHEEYMKIFNIWQYNDPL